MISKEKKSIEFNLKKLELIPIRMKLMYPIIRGDLNLVCLHNQGVLIRHILIDGVGSYGYRLT